MTSYRWRLIYTSGNMLRLDLEFPTTTFVHLPHPASRWNDRDAGMPWEAADATLDGRTTTARVEERILPSPPPLSSPRCTIITLHHHHASAQRATHTGLARVQVDIHFRATSFTSRVTKVSVDNKGETYPGQRQASLPFLVTQRPDGRPLTGRGVGGTDTTSALIPWEEEGSGRDHEREKGMKGKYYRGKMNGEEITRRRRGPAVFLVLKAETRCSPMTQTQPTTLCRLTQLPDPGVALTPHLATN
ncbi:hypothetical protein E2C01_012213 [Portunus trituberculatus]|uniref:Uncharacterized protein n=1 Tax=Portunus trituberculatus TaxID=210409 RepID=A0A5B7DD39_PORTR|nr:hypothetical protein [Portunus trituberculatus]